MAQSREGTSNESAQHIHSRHQQVCLNLKNHLSFIHYSYHSFLVVSLDFLKVYLFYQSSLIKNANKFIDRCAYIMTECAVKFCTKYNDSPVTEIRFTNFDNETVRIFSSEFRNRFGESTPSKNENEDESDSEDDTFNHNNTTKVTKSKHSSNSGSGSGSGSGEDTEEDESLVQPTGNESDSD